MDWDDLRIVLAIGEAGSLSGAGRRLAVSHATVFRRLGALESRLGVRLFERARDGYAPTPAGEELLAAARRVQGAVAAAERRIAGRDLRPAGPLRVTTTDTLLHGLLLPLLPAFRAAFPEIVLELVASNSRADLTKREADVALRPSDRPPERLVGRRLGRIAEAVYAARDSAQESTDLRSLDWIGPDPGLHFPALEDWLEAEGLAPLVVLRLDSLLAIRAAVAVGLGVAVLPCYLADPDPTLTRLGDPVTGLDSELWLLTHPDLRRTARVRAFLDFMGKEIAARAPLLAGEPSSLPPRRQR
ncbi:transcriptional regulator, LysR family [Tistlia consotensis]|uniref:Transcriptional regulator, LysR family n=1 Tax=Tistlia consotensis USBA 355 TaxID=560819 RepID=A0A1Y6CRY2_9PROT|nr:LysR family transcriptional regulator [Tistlia consotensis]SMF71795.1 transcriptional regulator, LysR family [Tistlia consotensis USBA 355]SNS06260.1 transcriptional regulator, LysR family [Tistlia consotensis]